MKPKRLKVDTFVSLIVFNRKLYFLKMNLIEFVIIGGGFALLLSLSLPSRTFLF